MKRPAFQFYPDKWLSDTELRSCGIAARGMWVDMLCIAHHAQPYGHLTLNGKRMTDAQIVNAISGSSTKLLRELEAAGVFSRTEDGTIYSRRMLRDEDARNARAEGGQLGAEHGVKGGSHGVKGGRPTNTDGGKKPPSNPSTAAGGGAPPVSASAVASASVSNGEVGVTPTDTARANGSHPAIENIAKATPPGQPKVEAWWKSAKGVAETAHTFGIERRQGETDTDFKDRVYAHVEQKRRADQITAAARAGA